MVWRLLPVRGPVFNPQSDLSAQIKAFTSTKAYNFEISRLLTTYSVHVINYTIPLPAIIFVQVKESAPTSEMDSFTSLGRQRLKTKIY
jgi:hypothetical protein